MSTGESISQNRTSLWWPNRLSAEKTKKMFHSSGTPSGKLDKIPRWKQTITTRATVVTRPPVLKASTNGAVYSTTVAPWAMNADSFELRMSVGWSR